MAGPCPWGKPCAEGPTLAAVDLGSNSFHLVVARDTGHDPQALDRLKEPVRLAAGLGADRVLSQEAIARAVQCLERFGQRLRGLSADRVRAVGTSTLRRALNIAEFLPQFEAALGHAIEIVPGPEEARLIYLGVAHSIDDEPGRRLVVDIGGGSTECILGEGFTPLSLDSLAMGCVDWTRRFFVGGAVSRAAMRAAITAARQELEPVQHRYGAGPDVTCYGSSGTIQAVAELLTTVGDGRARDAAITVRGLEQLQRKLTTAGHISRLELPGLRADRALVLPGGVAILTALMESFQIKRLRPASGALREGVLYDLMGRLEHADVRDRAVRALAERHQVDREQAARVETTVTALLEQVRGPWQLTEDTAMLAWAARLHELGHVVSRQGHHKHGAYLALHTDLAGFSKDDQGLLADLIRLHRKRIANYLRDVPAPRLQRTLRLAILLRLATVLHRSRLPEPSPPVKLYLVGETITVALPGAWLDRHPLTIADLESEAIELAEMGITLRCRRAP